MTTAKIVAALGVLAMLGMLVYGFVIGDFSGEGGQLLRMPWGQVSMVDLYVAFVLFSCWILYREGLTVVSGLWVLGVMVLGSFTISLYVLVALHRSYGNWTVFFFGRNAGREA